MQPADPFVVTLQEWIEVSMQRSMRNVLAYARESGLSMSQLGALFHVLRIGCSGVTDLGDDLGVTSSAASQLLDRLVQQGLIRRTQDPDDRRAKRILLTDKGLHVVRESIRARQGWVVELAESLSEPEKEASIAALHMLIDKANHLARPMAPDK
jgi:DNA-binding MarR family transcriptional regulator